MQVQVTARWQRAVLLPRAPVRKSLVDAPTFEARALHAESTRCRQEPRPITVDIDGEKGTATSDLVATDGHPTWVQSEHKWLKADQLKPGMWLRTSVGTYVQITTIRASTAKQRVHNFTIADTHTYYVLAGATPVLVHNCGGTAVTNGKTHSTKCTCADGGNPRIPPNPHGRNGGPRHQAVIAQVEQDLRD
ncbi:polymorphic toxin-type HINT domain-containing protein [Spongiactinospora rosea]|uniref:polymorphic toxin-type HINT domain-containing protein n=1 Tax=Spongiactinospora rosea TaxID=2248750 RepID=UPI0018F2A5A3|nr:polymorphic toxin-type HINT domain-containing protein [Spongiactinospora rosea]